MRHLCKLITSKESKIKEKKSKSKQGVRKDRNKHTQNDCNSTELIKGKKGRKKSEKEKEKLTKE
jgi:hypothetical protein